MKQTPERRKTLKSPAFLEGVGLHSGVDCRVALKPAAADAGVVFRRTDAGGDAGFSDIRASAETVSCVCLSTEIANGDGVSVKTIEHLMAALAICGVDNVIVEIDGPEAPILDGSAAPFVSAIAEAGVVELPTAKQVVRAVETIELRDHDRFIRLEPADNREIVVSIAFPEGAIGAQSVCLDLDDGPQLWRRLAPARTFCRRGDVEAMQEAGLGLGGSIDNAIVVDGDAILNEGGLRDPAEFALHKALDLVGDLHLLGVVLVGRLVAHKPGHDLNNRFARKLAGMLAADGDAGGKAATSLRADAAQGRLGEVAIA